LLYGKRSAKWSMSSFCAFGSCIMPGQIRSVGAPTSYTPMKLL
jgi:hypothetical protein